MEDENHQRTFSHLHKNRNRHTHDSFGIVLWYGSCTETELLRYSDLVGLRGQSGPINSPFIFICCCQINSTFLISLSPPSAVPSNQHNLNPNNRLRRFGINRGNRLSKKTRINSTIRFHFVIRDSSYSATTANYHITLSTLNNSPASTPNYPMINREMR